MLKEMTDIKVISKSKPCLVYMLINNNSTEFVFKIIPIHLSQWVKTMTKLINNTHINYTLAIYDYLYDT